MLKRKRKAYRTRFPKPDAEMTDYHARFLSLVDEIEATYPVAEWRIGAVQVWPLVRNALYIDMYWQAAGTSGTPAVRRQSIDSKALTAAKFAATPVLNLWRARSDMKHHLARPVRSDAVFLGDGISFAKIDGAYRDLFCEPIIRGLEANGRSSLLMARGDLHRFPLSRPTLRANT